MQPEKKYFKRGDLAAIQQQEYMQKYGSKAEEIVTEKERIREEKVEEKKRGKRIIHFNSIPDHYQAILRQDTGWNCYTCL
jgi:hypothetical protein